MNLRNLSDDDILSRIESLTKRERKTTLLILLHIAEVERRKLHYKLGYRSMFDYCTTGLAYSASAAARRIQAARCVTRFPEVYNLLAAGVANLSTVSQVSRLLTVDNKDDLLTRIRGKSQREVEAIVAEYRPQARPRDRVRTVVVRVPVNASGGLLAAPANSTSTCDHSRNGSNRDNSSHPHEHPHQNGVSLEAGKERSRGFVASPGDQPPRRPPAGARHESNLDDATNESNFDGATGEFVAPSASVPATRAETETANQRVEKRILFQFSAKPQFVEKLERIRAILWHRLPANPSLEQVFEFALDGLIEREDPLARRQRRSIKNDARRPKRASNQTRSGAQSGKRSRYIPAAVRDEVFARDDGRCTFVGPGERRCGSTQALQVDHIRPFALGGGNGPVNLRLLCAGHNRLEAERLLGQ